MEINKNSTQAGLKISQEVIYTIVNEAVKELRGIYSLANLPSKAPALKIPMFTQATSQKPVNPVKMVLLGDTARIDVGIIVNLNFKIRDVAEQVQSAVKNAVQDMTGIAVSKVNVYVAGVNLGEKTE